MAARYFINGGINNNWGDTSNWSDTSGGAGGFSVPTASDNVYFDALSQNCVVNASNRVCLSIDFTGYVNTFSEDSTARTLTVSGNVTLSSGATYTFAGTLIVNATATLTSNGSSWSGNLTLPTALSTSSFADNWYIVGNYSASNTTVEGGKTISVEGDVTTPINNGLPSSYCTIKFVGAGTQTLSTLGAIRMNVLIDKSGGSLTMLDASVNGIRFFGQSFIVAATNSSTIVAPTKFALCISCTIDVSTISFNDIDFLNHPTITNNSVWTINGTINPNTVIATINGSDVILKGDIIVGVGSIVGNSLFRIEGVNQLWNHTSTGTFRGDIQINVAGTLTIGSNIRVRDGSLTYIAGTIDSTTNNSTLFISTTYTLDTNLVNWNNINLSSALVVITNNSVLTIAGTLTYAVGASITINGSDIIINGSLLMASNGNSSGTSVIKFKGTGTWSHTGTGTIRNNVTIDTLGTLTFGSSIKFDTGTLTYLSGVIDATTNNSTLSIHVSCTLNTNGMSWNNILIVGGSLTLNSLLTATGTLTLPNSNTTFSGTAGFTVGTLTNTTLTAARTYTLASTKTYTITGAFTSNTNTSTIRPTFRSSVAASQAILTLNAGASQNLKFVNATDIDSSGGQTINSNKAVLSNATNWYRTNGTFMYLLAS